MACLGTDTLLEIASDRTPDRLRRFEDHFDSCAECRRLVAELAELSWMRITRTGVDAVPTQPVAFRERLPVGQVVDRYIVIELLGVGGMGAVYAAYDPRLDRKVALKVLRPTDRADELGARLLSEAKMLARLGHPNVVAVHDAGVVHGNVFLAMELVDGATLRTWLTERPRTWPEIVGVFLQAAAGLAAAHDAGVIHRDFKPDNVLIGRDGRTRVADFGLAAAPADRVSAIAGTPAYMAPEQRLGAVSALADQYSFCLALREGLETAASKPPGRIVAALERGLAEDPQRRHASIDALARALRPRAHRRTMMLGAALTAGVAIATFAAIRTPRAAGPTCDNAASELAEVWDARTRDALHQTFRATGRGDAERTFGAIAEKLDTYAGAWIAERTDSCEATHVRGEQSQALLDQRMACLDLERSELATRVNTLREVSASNMGDAPGMLADLSDPQRCHSRAALARQSRPVHAGDISDFDDGTASSRFGLGWSVSTDVIMGGRSQAHLDIVDGGFAASPKALAIAGVVDAGQSPVAWAGAMFYPGAAAMAPVDLSAHRTIAFAARGDHATFEVLLFSASKGNLPASLAFEVGDQWQEYRFDLTQFGGVNPADIKGLLFASNRPGVFMLQIDSVRFD